MVLKHKLINPDFVIGTWRKSTNQNGYELTLQIMVSQGNLASKLPHSVVTFDHIAVSNSFTVIFIIFTVVLKENGLFLGGSIINTLHTTTQVSAGYIWCPAGALVCATPAFLVGVVDVFHQFRWCGGIYHHPLDGTLISQIPSMAWMNCWMPCRWIEDWYNTCFICKNNASEFGGRRCSQRDFEQKSLYRALLTLTTLADPVKCFIVNAKQ